MKALLQESRPPARSSALRPNRQLDRSSPHAANLTPCYPRVSDQPSFVDGGDLKEEKFEAMVKR